MNPNVSNSEDRFVWAAEISRCEFKLVPRYLADSSRVPTISSYVPKVQLRLGTQCVSNSTWINQADIKFGLGNPNMDTVYCYTSRSKFDGSFVFVCETANVEIDSLCFAGKDSYQKLRLDLMVLRAVGGKCTWLWNNATPRFWHSEYRYVCNIVSFSTSGLNWGPL